MRNANGKPDRKILLENLVVDGRVFFKKDDNKILGSINGIEFLVKLSYYQLLKYEFPPRSWTVGLCCPKLSFTESLSGIVLLLFGLNRIETLMYAAYTSVRGEAIA